MIVKELSETVGKKRKGSKAPALQPLQLPSFAYSMWVGTTVNLPPYKPSNFKSIKVLGFKNVKA